MAQLKNTTVNGNLTVNGDFTGSAVLDINNGGTGAANATAALVNLYSNCNKGSGTNDDEYLITTKGTSAWRVTMGEIWDTWLKNKIPTITGEKGETGPAGPQGEKGDPGDAAGVGIPTVDNTTANNVGIATVEVTASGPDTAKVFNFKFKNLKGEPGKDSTVVGPEGRGISSITAPSGAGAAGATDIYTIHYTKGTPTSTFKVYNGKNGKDGDQGLRGPRGYDVKTVEYQSTDGNGGNVYKLKDSNGSYLDNTFTAPRGPQGPKGNDKYSITYDNGTLTIKENI